MIFPLTSTKKCDSVRNRSIWKLEVHILVLKDRTETIQKNCRTEAKHASNCRYVRRYTPLNRRSY